VKKVLKKHTEMKVEQQGKRRQKSSLKNTDFFVDEKAHLTNTHSDFFL
jgi:hypothetical protein